MSNIIHLKDHRPGAQSETASAPSRASKTQPGLAVSPPTPEVALEQRISARRAALIAKLIDHRGSAQVDDAGAGDRVKAKLSELAHLMREGVGDGWGNVGDNAKLELERWLAETAHDLTVPVGPG